MKNQFNTITIRHLVIENVRMIGLEYPNNPTLQALVSTFENIKWSEKYGLSYMPNSKVNLDRIYTIFRGVAMPYCENFNCELLQKLKILNFKALKYQNSTEKYLEKRK